MIFNIQRYSTHDGEGIRTVIFYKGCPLSCTWCSNPESQSFDYEILYDRKYCNQFGDCSALFPESIQKIRNTGVEIQRENIRTPELLKNTCASRAMTVSGESKSAEELLMEVEKDLPFYKNSGGVTLSGGEPLSQNGELTDLLNLLKEREINVNIETTLYVHWEAIENKIDLIDTFLVDVKHVDHEKFNAHVKGDLTIVFENLKRLIKMGAHVIARIPVIPGFNHTGKDMKRIIDYIASLSSIHEIHLLPYHPFGEEKYQMLGIDYTFGHHPAIRDEELKPYIDYAKSKGLLTKIGG